MWITCLRLDHVRFFLGFPDLVNDGSFDFELFFKLAGVGTAVVAGIFVS